MTHKYTMYMYICTHVWCVNTPKQAFGQMGDVVDTHFLEKIIYFSNLDPIDLLTPSFQLLTKILLPKDISLHLLWLKGTNNKLAQRILLDRAWMGTSRRSKQPLYLEFVIHGGSGSEPWQKSNNHCIKKCSLSYTHVIILC